MAIDPNTLQEDFTLLVPPASPVAEAREVKQSAVDYTLVLIIALALLVAGWIGLRWWRRGLRRTRSLERSDIVALRELEQWRSALDEARYREAVAAVSGTMRRYVEVRFGIHAPALTSEEFWEEQRAHRRIPPAYDPFWTDFLDTCDPIKYAGLHPHAEQFKTLLEASVGFVKASSGKQKRLAA